VPGAEAAHQGPNCNTQLYRSLFSARQDARFLGLAGSETESGQSGLQGTCSHKPPHSLGRSLTSIKFYSVMIRTNAFTKTIVALHQKNT
jgi:hypothetical protein